MLKQRILTAAILIPLVYLAIYQLSQVYFAWVMTAVLILAGWEWANLSGYTKNWQRILYILAILFVLILTCLSVVIPVYVMIIGAFWWSLITIGLFIIRSKPKLPALPHWSIVLGGFLVLIPFWHALVILHGNPDLLLYMLLMVWTCDTAAYFGGRQWGKHPLAPIISPKKTMEGLWTAMVVTVILAFALVWFVFVPSELPLSWILPVLPLIIAAVAGDLFESAAKRIQGVKDSGQLLPGHGGILDRIDSLTAAAPVFTCSVLFWKTLS